MAEVDYDKLVETEEPETPDEPDEAKAEEEPDEAATKAEVERDNYRRAMKEERAKRQELEQRMEKLESLKEQIESLKAAKDQPKDPEFMEDPKGYVDQRQARLEAEIKALKASAEDGSKQAQQQLAQVQFFQSIQADESSFIREHPDYYDALNHVREARTEELESLGLEEDEIKSAINQEELNMAAVALQRGKSAAEIAYNRAKKLGFKAKETNTDDLEEEADRLERAMKAGSMGGSGVPDETKIEDPEADAWAPIEQAFEELFGQKLK